MDSGELHFYRVRVRGRTCKSCNLIAEEYVSSSVSDDGRKLARFIQDIEKFHDHQLCRLCVCALLNTYLENQVKAQ
ncbi:unnamed protein product [Larinioides sclopetarius]|uniref:Uncharacterized protein n=1 Tax=Larinioides sclopetarius TaxID=280406 RepID=A0AAV1Z8A0_9ARAC